MRERGHVFNAVALGVGIGVLLEPSMTVATVRSVLAVGVPVGLGALLPDVDMSFGDHRVHGHNVGVLAAVVGFPMVFGNLAWVWLGVATHYALDLLGNVRGMALLYPLSRTFYDVPVGVNVDSRWADVVTVSVTALELSVAAVVVLEVGASDVHVPTEIASAMSQIV